MRAAKKKKDNKVIAGRIIGLIFILLLAGVIYFLVTLFRPLSISGKNIEGKWKKAGSTTEFYDFKVDGTDTTRMSGTCSYYEKETGTTKASNRKEYTYSIEKKVIDNAGKKQTVYTMTLVNVKDNNDVQSWKIKGVSRATLDVTINNEKTIQLTRVNIF